MLTHFKLCVKIAILITISNNLLAKEQENIPVLYETNKVIQLSDEIILDSVDGFDQAIMDISSIDIDINAFNVHNERAKYNGVATGQSVKLNLPAEFGEVVLEVISIDQDNDGFITYNGVVSDYPNSSFVLTSDDKRMMGQIVVKNQLFSIKPFKENHQTIHTLTWIDRNLIDSSHFNNDSFIAETNAKTLKSPNKSLLSKIQNNKSGGSNSVVRVLFLYANNVTNTRLKTKNIKNKYNTVLQNSGIQHTISVADIQVLNSDFGSDCRADTILKMNQETGIFSNIDTLVANTSADMVLVVSKGAVYLECGFGISNGRVGGQANLFHQNIYVDNSQNRYATTSDNYALSDLTAIHEIGHAMGGFHAMERDYYGNPVPSQAKNNNQAIVSNDAAEQTIMGGYNWEDCDFVYPINGNVQQQNCQRIEQFSKLPGSADPFTDNSPTGASNRNIAAYFDNITMPEISGYRSNPSAPTSAPSLTVTNWSCYGQNSLDWNLINLANSYQVYRSNYSNFTSPVRVYTGFDNFAFVNHSQAAYYRVKACNEGGCSGYSNQVYGQYIQGCM